MSERLGVPPPGALERAAGTLFWLGLVALVIPGFDIIDGAFVLAMAGTWIEEHSKRIGIKKENRPIHHVHSIVNEHYNRRQASRSTSRSAA